MLSFKNPTLFRFTERLSFKKLKECDDEPITWDTYSFSSDEVFEQAWMKNHVSAQRPIISYSDYIAPEKRFWRRNKRKQTVDVRDVEYNYDGTMNMHAMNAKNESQPSSPKSSFSLFNAVEGAIGHIKYKGSNYSLDGNNSGKSSDKFEGAGKVNADVKIQFDGDKFIYRV